MMMIQVFICVDGAFIFFSSSVNVTGICSGFFKNFYSVFMFTRSSVSSSLFIVFFPSLLCSILLFTQSAR